MRRDYRHLTTEEDILDEAFSRALGDRSMGQLESQGRLKDIFDRLWNLIRDIVGISPTMTLENITDQVLTDLLGGNVLSEISSQQVAYLEAGGQPIVRAAYTQGNGIKQESRFNSVEVSRHYDGMRALRSKMKIFANTPGGFAPDLVATADAIASAMSDILSDNNFITNDNTGTRVSDKEIAAFTRDNIEKVVDLMSKGKPMPAGELATLHQMAFSKGKKKNIFQKYHNWFKATHASVVDAAGNSTYTVLDSNEGVSGIKAVANTKAKADTAPKRRAFKFLFGMMSKVWNFDSATKFMDNNNFITGLNKLRLTRNADASSVRAQMYAKFKTLYETYKEQASEFTSIEFTNEYGKVETRQMSISEQIQIFANHKTQTEHSAQDYLDKNGVAMSAADKRKSSTVYYDPADAKYGLKEWKGNKKKINRGVQINNDPKGGNRTTTNVLFTEAQLAAFEKKFTEGNYANFFRDLMAVLNDDVAYNGLNNVFKRLNGRSLARVQNFFYPLQSNGLPSGAIQEISKNPESLSILKERKANGPVRISNRDVFKTLDKYNNDMFNYIANSEVVDGMGRYWAIMKADPDVLAEANDGNVETERQVLTKFLHDYTLRLKNQDQIKHKLTNEAVLMGVTYAQLMGNFAKSVFVMNAGNPLKQMTGFFSGYGMGIIDDKFLNQVALGAVGGTLQSYTSLVGMDQSKTSQSVEDEMRNDEYFQDGYLRFKGADSSSVAGVEFADNSSLGAGLRTPSQNGIDRLKGMVDSMANYGMEPMKRADREVIGRFYMAAKLQVQDMIDKKALFAADGKTPVTDINAPEARKQRAHLARTLTYATNQMFMDNDKTVSQLSDSPWIRALGIFSSQPQKMANTVMQTIYEAIQQNTFNIQNIKLRNSVLVSTLGASGWTSMISILYGMLKNGYDEERDYGQEFIWGTAYNILGMAPTFSTEIAKIVMGEMDNLPWENTLGQDPVLEIVSTAAKSVGGLSSYILKHDDPKADRVLEDAIRNGFDSFPKMIGISDSMVKYFLRDPVLSLVKDDE